MSFVPDNDSSIANTTTIPAIPAILTQIPSAQCNRCGHMIGDQSAHLERHQAYDNGAKYQCNHCQLGYLRPKGFRIHCTTIHGLVPAHDQVTRFPFPVEIEPGQITTTAVNNNNPTSPSPTCHHQQQQQQQQAHNQAALQQPHLPSATGSFTSSLIHNKAIAEINHPTQNLAMTTPTPPTAGPTNPNHCKDCEYDVLDIKEHNERHQRFNNKTKKNDPEYNYYRCWTCCLKFENNTDLTQHFNQKLCSRGVQFYADRRFVPEAEACQRCLDKLSRFVKLNSAHRLSHERFDSTGEKVWECVECCAAWAQKKSLVAHLKAKICQSGLDFMVDEHEFTANLKPRQPVGQKPKL